MLGWIRVAAAWVSRAVYPQGSALLLSGTEHTGPTYSPESALSTLARFPWVWTCVRALADDSSTLPLVAVSTGADGTRRLVSDPALALLDQPSAGVTGNLFRRQLRIDYELTGNAYVWRPSPVELIRLHPARVTVRTAGLAHQVIGYQVRDDDGRVHELAPSEVIHIRDVSWESGPAAALGESVVRCLHDDLTMELGVKKLAAKQAQRGRPDVVFSSESGISPEDQARIAERWERSAKDGKLAFTVGKGLTVQQLSWSPREFEFSSRSEQIRDTILAAFGVPPARAGLATANYGTQKQQMRTYWESIRARTKAFDDAFSRLARPGVRIEHDFADVEALQVSYTERQQRILTWVALGADANEAAAYEGFDDAPAMDRDYAQSVAPSSGSGTTARPEEPQGDKASDLSSYLREAAPRFERAAEAADSGASVDLLVQWEAERLYAVAEQWGSLDAVRAWAEQTARALLEAARAGRAAGHPVASLRAFGYDHGVRLLARLEAA